MTKESKINKNENGCLMKEYFNNYKRKIAIIYIS